MITLLRKTTPDDAFKMFTQTFKKVDLPAQLDNAFIHFTNSMNSLQTNCIRTIATYANQELNATFLDVLAVCHLFNSEGVLYGLLADFKEDLTRYELKIRKAKHNRDITGDIFCNDLHDAYTQTINKAQKEYNQARQNIYTIEGMITLIHVLKKTRLMTKEEKIKEAWGKDFPKNKGVDGNGWSIGVFWYEDFDFKKFDTIEISHGYYNIRPESLKGIENNNGWIKIESEADLPKECAEYDVIKNKTITKATYIGKDRWFVPDNDFPKTTNIHGITHYQPSLKPKPPIY